MSSPYSRGGRTISDADKQALEVLAAEDGIQRGVFFDTSGKMRREKVSATATHAWVFKTVAGKPFKWK